MHFLHSLPSASIINATYSFVIISIHIIYFMFILFTLAHSLNEIFLPFSPSSKELVLSWPIVEKLRIRRRQAEELVERRNLSINL